jgi:hypothetical protein
MPISVATFCHIWSLNLTQESVLFFWYIAQKRVAGECIRVCWGLDLKPKMWAQNEATDDQNEAVWTSGLVEWYVPSVESCKFVFLLLVPDGSLLKVVLVP